MNLKRFLIFNNYLSWIKKIRKKIKLFKLESLSIQISSFHFIWEIDKNQKQIGNVNETNTYNIFGIEINLEDKINWHQDKFSEFIYPNLRFDKIDYQKWFDKGIELVYPWELSRFYFGPYLAQQYLISNDRKYYLLFKKLVEDWIENNQFLIGVNWLSTMDASIRAVNWIVTTNLFYEIAKDDKIFLDKISKSLAMSAEYIYKYPLIEHKGLTTNHTTSAYAGLLFISITLKDNPRSIIWLDSAVKGLEKCITDQIYEDGIDFEGSIPYHRLVLELFAYSTIVAKANKINISLNFLNQLFKMFEYTASYLDKNGNAPQIGDNDSGRLMILEASNNNPYKNEHNHSYLLSIGEHIFDYKFKTQCSVKDNSILNYLPKIVKHNLYELNIRPRNTKNSISFKQGGAYFLKNDLYNLCVSCFPTGQNGKGGHNHLDVGGFTLSINGKQFIVDPGSFCYSRDRKERDKFRAYTYHNTLFNKFDEKLDLSENGYWSLKNYYQSEIINYSETSLDIKIKFEKDKNIRQREFVINNDFLTIENKCEGIFYTRLNLHPDYDNIKIEYNKMTINENFIIKAVSNFYNILINNYDFSQNYGSKVNAKFILIESKDILRLEIMNKL